MPKKENYDPHPIWWLQQGRSETKGCHFLFFDLGLPGGVKMLGFGALVLEAEDFLLLMDHRRGDRTILESVSSMSVPDSLPATTNNGYTTMQPETGYLSISTEILLRIINIHV